VKYDLLIRNGTVVHADAARLEDIAVADGKIVEIAPEIRGDSGETIDASGLHVLPGLIDSHVHFNEPGRTDWEGFTTGSSALAAGGGTCFFDMPLNSSPPVLDGESFDLKHAAGEKLSITDFALWGGLTPGNLDRLEELADRGVVGFKAFMCNSGIDDFARADDLTLYRGMRKAKQLGLPVAVHAESETITSMLTDELRSKGKMSIADYLISRPIVAEVEATQRAIILAEETGCKLHIVHVSNSRSIELVRRSVAARESDTTCETCPHYLILNEHDLHRLGAPAKCAPPLRSPGENDEMWQDLAGGKIAFVASDHSPAPASMKSGDDFFAIWGGIAGVQSTLSILLSRGPSLPLPRVAAVTSTNVAKRYAIPNKGAIDVGFDADLALVNVKACYELRKEHLLDRHKHSPYVGRTFHGVVMRTILRGQTIFDYPRTVAKHAGKLIRPARAS
jgi:allantoinase